MTNYDIDEAIASLKLELFRAVDKITDEVLKDIILKALNESEVETNENKGNTRTR